MIDLKKLENVAMQYKTAKEHLLFSENFTGTVSIGVLNELRNALDHVMIGVAKDSDDEIEKAIRHLRRATYDALEITSMEATREIMKKISKYDVDIIVKVLPEYYKEIYPSLIALQKQISIERSKTDELFENDNLDKYIDLNKQLIIISDKVSEAVVGMEAAQAQIKKSNRFRWLKNILFIVAGSFLGSLFTYLFSLFQSNPH